VSTPAQTTAAQTQTSGSQTTVGDWVFSALCVVTAASFVGTIAFVFLEVPVEATMGIVQKIFYFHVPCWYAMYIGALACFVGSAGYLYKGSIRFDALARAGADVAVVTGLMGLISGPLWAIKAWGKAWTWDPRLTTALLSFLIYVAYLVLRSFTAGGEGERKFAAALGVLGAANLPIIHYAVKKWGGQHPNVIGGGGGGLQDPDMKRGFLYASISFLLLAGVLIWQRTRVHLAEGRVAALEEEAIELGLAGE
jgi:heme exporter protein C